MNVRARIDTQWRLDYVRERFHGRNTTYRTLSPVNDPSELGSEPDSWLELRVLRAQDRRP